MLAINSSQVSSLSAFSVARIIRRLKRRLVSGGRGGVRIISILFTAVSSTDNTRKSKRGMFLLTSAKRLTKSGKSTVDKNVSDGEQSSTGQRDD